MSQHADLTNGTDYVSDEELDNLISDLGLIIEEARATDYHDTLRKATLFLNLHRSKVFEYAKTIVRLEAAGNEQLAAYNKACERADMVNDPEHAKAVVRSAGYCLVTRNFIEHFADFIHDYVKGDFDLPKLAAIDVQGCFDAWQEEVNQKEVVINLQTEPATKQPADLDQIIDNYVDDYEMIGEAEDGRDACHTPTESERALIKDAIRGLLADTDWDNAWGAHIKSLSTAEPVPMVAPPSFWVLESSIAPMYWDGRFLSRGIDPRHFVNDINQAVKFISKQEAEKVAGLGSSAVATEHMFIGIKPKGE